MPKKIRNLGKGGSTKGVSRSNMGLKKLCLNLQVHDCKGGFKLLLLLDVGWRVVGGSNTAEIHSEGTLSLHVNVVLGERRAL